MAENHMAPAPPGDDDDDENRQWNNALVFVAVIVIVVIACVVLWKMREQEKMQACLITGRRDCAPADIPGSP